MRLLVTGGAGFIGSNFIRYWLDLYPDDAVTNVDALTYAADKATLADVERAHGPRYSFFQADIADRAAITEAFEAHPPDVVVNFAAESHNSRGVLDPTIFVRTNVVGTQTLLEETRRRGVSRFHHISTCEVYGDLPLETTDAFTEESPYRPRTPYNASKAAADHVVRAYHNTYGVPVTISNCANNYGPWQHPEKVIPLFTTNALDDVPLPVYKQSQNRREWIHVIDHCRAIDLILRRGQVGETYNVGTGDERTVDQIAETVLATLGKPPDLRTYVEDRPGHDRRYLLDHAKITRELGWHPQIVFDEGIRSTIEWYAQHEDWWRPKKAQVPDEFSWRAAAAHR
ncbi:MAG: dTDP-glucose 4,6-dehydratase [Chloroflexota bacterium]|nr:dTDP-glucose 4,6-dehydratase [Chloroflexota bacterium]